ncbi:MAG: sulfotransferase [Ruegeria sp.]
MVSDFALVATQRTGSTLLEELLSSADDCHVFPEIFSRQQPFYIPNSVRRRGLISEKDVNDFQEAVLNIKYRLFRIENNDGIVLGAHLMWNQIADTLVERLIASGQKIVFLERSNILAVYRSALFAREKGLSHIRTEAKPISQGKVSYDHDEFKRFSRRILGYYGRREGICQKFPFETMTLHYDQLAKNNFESVNRIRAFLGLPAADTMSSDLKKRQSTDILRGFENPEEVEEGMRALGMEQLLDPEF